MVLTQDKVLIQLDEHPDHTVTESNIYIPQFISEDIAIISITDVN